MTQTVLCEKGYACIPYVQNGSFADLQNDFIISPSVENVYLATATFSDDGKAYFPTRSNTYLLMRFTDGLQVMQEISKHVQESPAFVFTTSEEFFERIGDNNLSLLSVYFLENADSQADILDLGMIVAKRNRVQRAELGHLKISTTHAQKFTFPYEGNLVALAVSSDNKHQSDSKYCEKTKKDVQRKGISMITLLNFSIIETLK